MTDVTRLATELLALPPTQRAAVLRAAGPIDETLRSLADEVERLAVSEVARSLELSEMAATLAEALGGDVARARVLRARAQSLGYAGRFEQALPVYKQAAALAERGGAALEAAHARMSSLHALASLGRYGEAIAAGKAARAAFEANGELVQAAKADVNLGATYQMCDQPAEAIRHLDRARPQFLSDAVTLAKIDSNRGHAYLGMDAFADAERAYHAAQPTFETHGMTWASAIVEGNLAELATRQGRLQHAFSHFERARRHLERDETPADLARIVAEQADALATLGLLDEALAAYREALPALEAAGLAAETARAKAGIGRALLRCGREEEAATNLRDAAAGFEQLGHATPRARIDVLRGALLSSQGRLLEADALLTTATATLADRPADLAVARYHLSRHALAQGQLDRASAELNSAIEVAGPLQIRPLLADLMHARSRLHRARGSHTASQADLQTAIEHAERVRGALQADRFRAAFHGERMALYEDAVLAALESGSEASAAEAFGAVERAKSRALLDLVGGAVGADDDSTEADAADTTLARKLAAHRKALNGLYSRLADAALGDAAHAPLDRWRTQIAEHEQAIAGIEARLANARGVADLFSPTPDVDAVTRALPPDTALVEYFIAGGELMALVVRDGRVHVARNAAAAGDLAERVRRLYFQIRRAMRPGAVDGTRGARLLDDARRELGSLHDSLIAPLRAWIDGLKRLVIVPHGPLHAVPFAALWTGSESLLDAFEIVAAPSAGVYLHCRTKTAGRRPTRGAVVVGVADAAAPKIAAETQRIANTLDTPTVLEGAAATVAAVSAAARDARIIHLACHGHFSSENPAASGLKLADRWMSVRDVYGLRLQTDLVTLSGCETGQSVVSSGDELAGLVRAFFAAGTSGLLVSLWTVNDESTGELMASFYDAWRGAAARPSAAAAYRAAQRHLASSRAHPAFWAPFVMMGEA